MSKKTIYYIIIFSVCGFLISCLFYGRASVRAQVNLQSTPIANDSFILNWSADSYVPPGYAGKALPTRNGYIKVVAVPTKMLPMSPDRYYYRWLLDGNLINSAGGQGRASFTFQVAKWSGNSYNIEAQILEANDTLVSTKTVSIDIAEPALLLRQNNDDYSLTDSFQTPTGREIKIDVLPLFFNIKKISDIDWQWQLDGQIISAAGQKDPSQIDIKIPSGTVSTAFQKYLSVSAINRQDPNQSLKSDLTIKVY